MPSGERSRGIFAGASCAALHRTRLALQEGTPLLVPLIALPAYYSRNLGVCKAKAVGNLRPYVSFF